MTAQHLRERTVVVDDPSGRVGETDPHRGRLVDRTETPLAPLQPLEQRERSADENERRDRERQHVRVPLPDACDGDAERSKQQIGRQAVPCEEARLANRAGAGQAQGSGQQHVIRADEDDARRGRSHGISDLRVSRQALGDELCGPPGGESVEREVRDVEDLEEPRIPATHEVRSSTAPAPSARSAPEGGASPPPR